MEAGCDPSILRPIKELLHAHAQTPPCLCGAVADDLTFAALQIAVALV
jgi:hypothetical protein